MEKDNALDAGKQDEKPSEKASEQELINKGFNLGFAKKAESFEKEHGIKFEEAVQEWKTLRSEVELLKKKAQGMSDDQITYQKLKSEYDSVVGRVSETENKYQSLVNTHSQLLLESQLIKTLRENGLVGEKERKAFHFINGEYRPTVNIDSGKVEITGYDSMSKFVKDFKDKNPDFFATTQIRGAHLDQFGSDTGNGQIKNANDFMKDIFVNRKPT